MENKESKAKIAENVARIVAASVKSEKKPSAKTKAQEGSTARARKMLKDLVSPQNVEQDKKNAQTWFEKFVSGGDERKQADQELASKKFSSKVTSKEAHTAALKAYELRDPEIHGEAPKWLSDNIDDFKGNARASEFATRIALLPKELQEDPYVLMREARRLSLSTDWASATPEVRKQTQEIIDKTVNRAWSLSEGNPEYQEFMSGAGEKKEFSKELLSSGGEGGAGDEPPEAPAGTQGEDEGSDKRPVDKGSMIVGIGARRSDIFEGLSYDNMPDEVKNLLDSRKQHLNDPARWGTTEDEILLRATAREIEDFAKNKVQNPDQQLRLYDLRARIEEEMTRQHELRQIPNSITITWAEVKAAQAHVFGAMDKWVAEVINRYITDPSSGLTEEALHRLRLKLSYFLSPHFDESQISVHLEGAPGGAAQMKEAIQKLKSSLATQRERYFDQYTAQLHGGQFHLMKRNAAEVGDKDLQGIVNRLTERDFYAFDGMYGGLGGEGASIFWSKYERFLRDSKEGRASFLGSEEWLKARKEAIEEMIKRKPLYNSQFEDYQRGKYFQKEGDVTLYSKEQILKAQESGISQTYEEACAHIIDLASIKMEMWLDQTALNVRGLSPQLAERIYGSEAPTAFRQKRPFESIVRFISFHPEIWSNIQGRPAAEATVLRNLGQLMAHASPDIRTWAEESAREFRARLRDAEPFLHGQSFANLSEPHKRLMGEVRALFFYNLDHIGGPPESEVIEFSLKLLKEPRIKWLQKDPLVEEFLVQHGLEIAESHLMFPYINVSSYWRRNEFWKQFNRVFGEEAAKKIFVSGRLIGAAHDYFPKKYSGDPLKAQVKYLGELHEIAALRPDQLSKALFEKDDPGAIAWFSQRYGGRAQSWQEIMNLTETTSLLNRHLVRADEPPIDFSRGLAGLTGEENSGQRGMVNKIFREALGGDEAKNLYFARMQELVGYLRGNGPGPDQAGAIRKFTNLRYRSIFMLPYWNDDLSIDLLENPDRLGRRDATGNIISVRSISDILSSGTWDEQSGDMRRNHRDFAGLERGKPFIMQAFKDNEEELVKALGDLFEVIVPVQGGDTAAIAVTQLLGAWEKSAGVYRKWGPWFESLPNSSPFKRWGFGALSVSKSVDELLHLTHTVERKIGKIHTNHHGAAGFFDSMNSFVGATRWRELINFGKRYGGPMERLFETFGQKEGYEKFVQWLDEYHPSGVRKMKLLMFPVYFALLLAIYTATQAASDGKEKTSGGGHH